MAPRAGAVFRLILGGRRCRLPPVIRIREIRCGGTGGMERRQASGAATRVRFRSPDDDWRLGEIGIKYGAEEPCLGNVQVSRCSERSRSNQHICIGMPLSKMYRIARRASKPMTAQRQRRRQLPPRIRTLSFKINIFVPPFSVEYGRGQPRGIRGKPLGAGSPQ